MKKEDKIAILQEFKEFQELKNKALKRYDELKKLILADIEAGKYGDYVLAFEERSVKEYVSAARVDTLVKVIKI
jgi:hypothetical protein